MTKLFHDILGLWRKFWQTEMVKVFSFTSVATMVRMLTGLISVKMVAVIVGPSGVALIGQLHNFSYICLNLATGGISTGITKYISEHKNAHSDIIKQYISSAFRITLYCSLLLGICLIAFHRLISKWVLLSPQYGYVFVVFGVTILLFALNVLLLSIINGYKEYKRYVKINIANSICSLTFTVVLVYFFGLKGALISVVTFQSVMLFVTFLMVRKLPWLKKEYFLSKLQNPIVKKYLRYSLMFLVNTAVIPLSQLILRGYVISEISDVHAGWWEAMNRLSGMYSSVITMSFSVYFLPRLSELTTRIELRQEIFKTYKILIPILIIGFTAIYFSRFLIIRLVFTQEFLPMENLFIWQLSGDLFAIVSWVFAYLMLAKSMTKAYIITVILNSALFVGLAFLLMKSNGIVGITQAFFITYILYAIVLCIIFKEIIFIKMKPNFFKINENS